MKRIALIAALLASASAARAADQLPLAEISDYLNGITTAQGPFTQINDDGSLSTGRLYLQRPGRMRFEYDPPDSGIVVAGGGTVVIQDPKSNEPSETYPLRRTPLWIILARKVDLSRDDMVVGQDFDGTSTIVMAQDPEHPEYGRIDLMFTDDPVRLSKWVIHDGNGGQTTVMLEGLETGDELDPTLFATDGSGTAGNQGR